MVLTKRGIFFSTLVLVIITLVALTYGISTLAENQRTFKSRVDSMNSFLGSTEEDLSRQAYTAGFRITLLMINKITTEGSYINTFSALVNESFENGTMNGQVEPFLVGINKQDIQDTLSQRARKLNLNITLTNPTLTLTQTDPWHINVTLRTQLLMKDLQQPVQWNRTEIITTLVPIEGFEDPLYIIGTSGQTTNIVSPSPYTLFANGTDISNLLNHTRSGYYIASADAPSFLSRLQGSSTADAYGIESLVNLDELAEAGVTVRQKSVADHVYFSSSDPTTNQIQGMPSWFRLDATHLATYNVTSLAY